ncbi:hypothetical protein EDEG_02449 [Edhazardia aedis USNM 41457]|uniref:BZIP domain-containing protein n=1 Tax=Edhazardia aedis (strain USNM 41457) TaxID=1003232 RepID=J9D5Y8_EDHAE|nr:hypothetical protein EDEG_02449 [Edhazardia aedis USNM 41457]|eukprot:EJW03196.1 hypothetical protein EDEG_02449 [Edhazardia aedis USNM 41457]
MQNDKKYIQDLVTENKTLRQNVSKLNSQITAQSNEIKDLKDEINELKKTLSNSKNESQTLKNKLKSKKNEFLNRERFWQNKLNKSRQRSFNKKTELALKDDIMKIEKQNDILEKLLFEIGKIYGFDGNLFVMISEFTDSIDDNKLIKKLLDNIKIDKNMSNNYYCNLDDLFQSLSDKDL